MTDNKPLCNSRRQLPFGFGSDQRYCQCIRPLNHKGPHECHCYLRWGIGTSNRGEDVPSGPNNRDQNRGKEKQVSMPTSGLAKQLGMRCM